MYGVSKINIEPSLMMISVQDVEFKGNSLARYLQIFADTGVVVDMISQSAPHGTTMDFSFTASASDLPLVMKAISAANLDKDAKASPLISVGYSKLNLFGEEMVTSCGVAAVIRIFFSVEHFSNRTFICRIRENTNHIFFQVDFG